MRDDLKMIMSMAKDVPLTEWLKTSAFALLGAGACVAALLVLG